MKKTIALLWGLLLITNTSLCHANNAGTEKLTVMLDWSLNTTHAPLVIAQQQGYFKQQGLDVQLVTPNTPGNTTKIIAQKKADIGLTYEPWFIEHVDQGAPIIQIGTLIDKPLNCIVALKRSGIKSLTDLKGKQIGTSSNHLTSTILTATLHKQGISNSDINIVNINENLTQALLNHKVDAVSGMLRNLEVPMLEKSGHKIVVFFPEEHGMPNYSEVIFISNRANANDPRFPKFLAAIKQAVRYLDDHPELAWQQFTQQYPHLKNDLGRQIWFATLPYFAENPMDFDHTEWHRFAEFMQQHKMISKAQPTTRYTVIAG